jgi:hypothetical protein
MKPLLYALISFLIIGLSFGRPVTFAWNANPVTDGVTHYRLYKIVNGTRNLLGTVPVESTTLTADVNSNDEIGVTAFRSTDGTESLLSTTIFVPYVIPSIPTGFTVRLYNSRTMRFSWNPNKDIDFSYYILQYGKNSNVYTTTTNTTNTYALVNKFPVGYYYARLTAVNVIGQKSVTPEIEIKVGKKTVTIVTPL